MLGGLWGLAGPALLPAVFEQLGLLCAEWTSPPPTKTEGLPLKGFSAWVGRQEALQPSRLLVQGAGLLRHFAEMIPAREAHEDLKVAIKRTVCPITWRNNNPAAGDKKGRKGFGRRK